MRYHDWIFFRLVFPLFCIGGLDYLFFEQVLVSWFS
jgi:hypothetical protein